MFRQSAPRSRRAAVVLVALIVTTGAFPVVLATTTTPSSLGASPGPNTSASSASSTDPVGSASSVGDGVARASGDGVARSTQAGDVTSEGVAAMNLSAAHAAGYTGEGTTIVVIGDGFDTTNPEIADQVVETKDFTGRGIGEGQSGLHGTAVAEVVADTAPDANLVLVRANTEVQLYQAIDYVDRETSADVVTLSRNWRHGGALDGESRMDEAISESVADGTTWFVSAGNAGNGKHWSGTWQDPDGDGWHNFADTRETSSVVLPSAGADGRSSVSLSLQWDAWPQTGQDYDLYLTDTTEMNCTTDAGQPTFCEEDVVASSTVDQTGHQEPWELVASSTVDASAGSTNGNPTLHLAIRASDADGNARFHLFAGDDHRLAQDADAAESLLLPAANPDVITVGATGEDGNRVADYSSQGPTVDGRSKPDLVAPAGVSTSAVGEFRGTSAAAPHAAGVAAVLLEANDDLGPTEIERVLKRNAAPVSGPDSAAGAGLVDAGASLQALSATDSTPEPTPTATATPTSEPTATDAPEPTATTTPEPTPTATPEPTPTATAEPTASDPAPTTGDTPEQTPTATPMPEPAPPATAEPTASDPTSAASPTADPTTAPTTGANDDPSGDDSARDAGGDGGGGGASAGPGVSQDGGLGVRSIDAPETATADTSTTVLATLSNTDVVEQRRTVELRVDGRVVDERTVRLESGGETTVRFEYAFAESGDHRVSVGSQETNVAVRAADSDSTDDGPGTAEGTSGTSVGTADGDSGTAAPEGAGARTEQASERETEQARRTSSEMPGFSAVLTLVALAAVLVLARRRT
jgi:PGF-CTERM protein